MKDLINLVKHTLEKNVTVNGEGSRNNYTKLTFSDNTVVELSVEENGFGIRINFDKWVAIPSNYDRGRVLAVLQGKEYIIVDEEDSILCKRLRDIPNVIQNVHVNKLKDLLNTAKTLGIKIQIHDSQDGYYGIMNDNNPMVRLYSSTTVGKAISEVEVAIDLHETHRERKEQDRNSLFTALRNKLTNF